MNPKAMALKLRDQAAKMIKAAEALEEISFLSSDEHTSNNSTDFSNYTVRIPAPPSDRVNPWNLVHKDSGSRIDQLRNLLSHNPMTLSQIVNSGIPKGTASALMTEKNGFRKDFLTGKWIAI